MAEEERIRILRVLEIEGPRSKVEKPFIDNRYFKGTTRMHGGVTVREAFIGDSPEVVTHESDGVGALIREVAGLNLDYLTISEGHINEATLRVIQAKAEILLREFGDDYDEEE